MDTQLPGYLNRDIPHEGIEPEIERSFPASAWEVIVKYNGNIARLADELNATVEPLNNSYAIITLAENQIPKLYDYAEVEYLELPKTLTLSLRESLISACIPGIQLLDAYDLKGEGTLIAILDSGIDYRHPNFINEDGTSRILFFWDQSAQGGTPPSGFRSGTEYTHEDFNRALASDDPYALIPRLDINGHGTAVAGIAAGNGRASTALDVGVAPEAGIIAVRLGQNAQLQSFARTTELMRAVRYVINKALALNMPIAINISYGTNDGAHDGLSLFETYLDDMAQEWKNVICVATGNEGTAAHHLSTSITEDNTTSIQFYVGGNINSLYLTGWKSFSDTFSLQLFSPNGESGPIITSEIPESNFIIDRTNVSIHYGLPNHNTEYQELFIWFYRTGNHTVRSGIWTLEIRGVQIVVGDFNIWLPAVEDVGDTAFLHPATQTTLTIPSTARNVITVGGYNASINTYAPFSGRGPIRNSGYQKPDLVAPAVNIYTTRIGGGYGTFSGTSFAAPFVTGAAALIMEWGIVRGNDPFLYSQKVKAFLCRNTNRNFKLEYPNPIWGYGSLCLRSVIDDLRRLQNL